MKKITFTLFSLLILLTGCFKGSDGDLNSSYKHEEKSDGVATVDVGRYSQEDEENSVSAISRRESEYIETIGEIFEIFKFDFNLISDNIKDAVNDLDSNLYMNESWQEDILESVSNIALLVTVLEGMIPSGQVPENVSEEHNIITQSFYTVLDGVVMITENFNSEIDIKRISDGTSLMSDGVDQMSDAVISIGNKMGVSE